MKNQVPNYQPEQNPRFITDSINNSDTPISTAMDVSTAGSTENCWSDGTAQQVKMSVAEQLAFRNKALNAAEPWALDGNANTLPDFQAGEVDD